MPYVQTKHTNFKYRPLVTDFNIMFHNQSVLHAIHCANVFSQHNYTHTPSLFRIDIVLRVSTPWNRGCIIVVKVEVELTIPKAKLLRLKEQGVV